MRKLAYVIGTTIDGYIAAPDGDLSFFPIGEDVVAHLVEHHPDTLPSAVRQQLGIDGPPQRFDTAVQGRGAYELAERAGITSPYAHLRQFVVSTGLRPNPDIEIIAADPLARIRALKEEPGQDIYLVGGGRLAGTLLPEIDELVVKIYPVVAGAGIPAFSAEFSPTAFRLTGQDTLEGGMVVLSYARA